MRRFHVEDFYAHLIPLLGTATRPFGEVKYLRNIDIVPFVNCRTHSCYLSYPHDLYLNTGPPTLYVGSYEGTQVRYFDRQMAFLLHPGALTRILDRRY